MYLQKLDTGIASNSVFMRKRYRLHMLEITSKTERKRRHRREEEAKENGRKSRTPKRQEKTKTKITHTFTVNQAPGRYTRVRRTAVSGIASNRVFIQKRYQYCE